MLREKKKNFLIDLAFFITIAAIIYFVFRFLAVYLFPFVIGLLITIVVQKPAKFISEHTHLKKGICAMLLVMLTYVAIISLIGLIVYLLYVAGYHFVRNLPDIFSDVSGTMNDFSASINSLMSKMPDGFKASFDELSEGFISTLGSTFSEIVSDLAKSIALNTPAFIVVSIVTIVASCYIAKDLDKFKHNVKSFVKPSYYDIASEIKHIIYDNVFKMVKGYFLIMLITFCELIVGLLILRVPFAPLIALLIAFVDILPILGCGTVLIPWGVICLIQGNYLLGIGLLALYVIILIIRNILEPKIIGTQVGMHPLITLLLIFTGLKLIGVLGMFILPIFAIVIIELYKSGKLNFLHFGEHKESDI